jgi:hypothetical protein
VSRLRTITSSPSRRIAPTGAPDRGGACLRDPPPTAASYSATLPAGEYFIAALTDLDPDGWQTPAFLEQVASAAFKIRLAEGEKKVQDIKVAK